jgi:hypothetical protein
MGTVTTNYDTTGTVTITLASLANGAYQCSEVKDNTTDKYVDIVVGGSIQIGAPTADGTIEIYAYGSYDGTTYTGGVPGTNTTITWGTTGATSVHGYSQLKLLQVLDVDDTDDNKDVIWGPVGIAQAFGGVLPIKWGLVIRNVTGVILHATGTNNEVQYMGIKYDYA